MFEQGFTAHRLILTYSSFAAQASPVNIHNLRNGHIRDDHRLIGSGVVGHGLLKRRDDFVDATQTNCPNQPGKLD